MKTDNKTIRFLFYGIIILSLIAAGYWIKEYIDNQNNPPPDPHEKEIEELKLMIDKSDSSYKALELEKIKVDSQLTSLENELAGIIKKDSVYQNEIDEAIAEDSSKAIIENRKALRELGVITANSLQLENYEMVWNAKFLKQNYGLRLQVENYSSQVIANKNKIWLQEKQLTEKQNKIDALDSLKSIHLHDAEYYKAEYENTQGLFYDRFVVAIGPVLYENGISYLAIMLGIKIWGFFK